MRKNKILYGLSLLAANFALLSFLSYSQAASKHPVLLAIITALCCLVCVQLIIHNKRIWRIDEIRYKETERINKENELFFSLMVHDLKNPVQSLVLVPELLKNASEKQKGHAEIKSLIDRSVSRQMELVDRLVEWVKLQRVVAGNTENDCDIRSVVASCLAHFREDCDHKEITITNYITAGSIVKSQALALEAVLRNLLHNAIKYTPPGGLITINSQYSSSSLVISITDTGVGMSNEKIEKLFTPGGRSCTPGTMNEKGSGIGLLLCYSLVNKLGGHLAVTSKKGEGSTFTLSLPLRSAIEEIPSRIYASRSYA